MGRPLEEAEVRELQKLAETLERFEAMSGETPLAGLDHEAVRLNREFYVDDAAGGETETPQEET